MSIQYIFVGLIVMGAVLYAAIALIRKTKTFSGTNDCAAGCGCTGKSKNPSSKIV